MPAVGAREWQCLHGGRRGTRPGNRRRAARGTPTPWSAAESGNEMGFKFPIRDSIMIGDSLPVSRPNRERELGTSGSGRHPSAGPWQFKKERGGRPESAFEGLKATFSLGSCLLYSRPQGIPDFLICGESGNGGFTDSRFRPSRESGIPSLFPGQIGMGGTGIGGLPGGSAGDAGSAAADFDSESGIRIHDPAARVSRMCPASHTRPDKTAAF